MKIKVVASIFLIACILGGCSNVEARPGTYMSNDSADFPFPTSGYTVYFVGETHGNPQTKQVFQVYLKSLYEKTGVRDVILEEDQAYEADANAYIQGQVDELTKELCLRADILGIIRDFNKTLPADDKVAVHLVDVDSPLRTIYKHLTELHDQLGPQGAAITLPTLEEVETWGPKSAYDLVAELQSAATGQPDVLHELENVRLSFRWYFLGNRLDAGMPVGLRKNFAPIREDVITGNVEYLLKQRDGKPVMAFFGAAHGMKTEGTPNLPVDGFKPWVQRLVESGVSVYALSIEGLSGTGYWHGEAFPYEQPDEQQYGQTRDFKFEDGTPIVSLFETHPDQGIIYVDLRAEDNSNVQLPSIYLDIPASQIFDGLIIFEEFTPMEDACGE